jgi:hypothetical protein
VPSKPRILSGYSPVQPRIAGRRVASRCLRFAAPGLQLWSAREIRLCRADRSTTEMRSSIVQHLQADSKQTQKEER